MLHRAPLSVLLEQRLPGALEDVKHILAAGQLDHVGGNVLALPALRLPDGGISREEGCMGKDGSVLHIPCIAAVEFAVFELRKPCLAFRDGDIAEGAANKAEVYGIFGVEIEFFLIDVLRLNVPDLPLFFGDVPFLLELALFHQVVGNAAGVLDGVKQLLRILLQHLDPALDIGFVQVEMFVQSLLGHLQPQLLGNEGAGNLRPQFLPCVVLTAEMILDVAVQPVRMAGGVAALMKEGGDVAVRIVEAGLRRQRHHIG